MRVCIVSGIDIHKKVSQLRLSNFVQIGVVRFEDRFDFSDAILLALKSRKNQRDVWLTYFFPTACYSLKIDVPR